MVFTQGPSADVFVGLSTGTGFTGGAKWNEFFGLSGEQPRIGDFNGDGAADIATFTVNAAADVYVGLSTRNSFTGGAVWNDFFGLAGEFPYTGDFNGDGKDDIVTFTHNDLADVFVGLSTGTGFTGGALWNDFFGRAGETSL